MRQGELTGRLGLFDIVLVTFCAVTLMALSCPALAGDDYQFEELNVNINPAFSLSEDLTMGNWTYKALRVTNRRTREVSLAIQLNVELAMRGFKLPPISVDAEASKQQREVGSGFLIAKSMKMNEKNLYSGMIIVSTFDLDRIRITSR